MTDDKTARMRAALSKRDKENAALREDKDRAFSQIAALREELERRDKLDIDKLCAALGRRITGTIKPEDMQAAIDEARG